MSALNELSCKFFNRKLNIDDNDKNCLSAAIDKFCRTGTKEDAFTVYFCFCEIYKVFGKGYDTMSKLLELLSDHEYHSGELLIRHRDHYSHSVYVFALGLSIYAEDKSFADAFSAFYGSGDASDFLYLWGLTALFHDIGYPFELAHAQVGVYTSELWHDNDSIRPYVSFGNMGKLLEITPQALGEINYRLSVKTVNELFALHINARLGYPILEVFDVLNKRYSNQPKYMDHAYFSAVLLARQLMDAGKPFLNPLLDVLIAILLHNKLNSRSLSSSKPFSVKTHPLAYLLVLCDELQNWDRTAFGYVSKKDPLAWTVDINIRNGILAIAYVFDSDKIVMPSHESCECGHCDNVRENENVKKIRDGSFIENICGLIDSHVKIEATATVRAKEKKRAMFASSDKFINLCDFARAIHESYRKEFGGPVFSDLSLEFKLSNIEQAKSYAYKLELINCFYSDKELDYPIVNGFVRADEPCCHGERNDLNFLAREEHLRWVREKLANGWRYGREYVSIDENGNEVQDKSMRDSEKIHKDIVPYDCLSEYDRKKDELMIANMVPFLYQYGHGVRIYSYRDGRKPTLNIAGCGHRTIAMNNNAARAEIKRILANYAKDYRVVVRTNFAFGADQIIAECANELGITLKAVLPYDYEEYIERIKEDASAYKYKFSYDDELRMRHLLAQAVSCKTVRDDKFGYLEASKYIINKCDKLIALWDGVETKLIDEHGMPINQGGTWHNICLASQSRGLKDTDIHIVKCER